MENFLAFAKTGSLKSREQLQSILDVLPIPVSWASLADGRIQFMNQAFKKTFGYSENDFSNVSEWIEQTYVREDHRQMARESWSELWYPSGEGMVQIEAQEFEIRRSDGETLIVSHRGIILEDHGIGVAIFEDITERKMAERALRASAFQDPLTHLGNRRALSERWQEEMRGPNRDVDRMAAVLMVDLDHFKPVNDSMGHDAGDEVLRMVARRLKNSVRDTDLVVRMGGDEFAILLTDLAHQGIADAVCRRVEKIFHKPFNIFGIEVNLGVSIGASLYPRDSSELSTLLQMADEALYDIKRNGKGGWNWFSTYRANVTNFAI